MSQQVYLAPRFAFDGTVTSTLVPIDDSSYDVKSFQEIECCVAGKIHDSHIVIFNKARRHSAPRLHALNLSTMKFENIISNKFVEFIINAAKQTETKSDLVAATFCGNYLICVTLKTVVFVDVAHLVQVYSDKNFAARKNCVEEEDEHSKFITVYPINGLPVLPFSTEFTQRCCATFVGNEDELSSQQQNEKSSQLLGHWYLYLQDNSELFYLKQTKDGKSFHYFNNLTGGKLTSAKDEKHMTHLFYDSVPNSSVEKLSKRQQKKQSKPQAEPNQVSQVDHSKIYAVSLDRGFISGEIQHIEEYNIKYQQIKRLALGTENEGYRSVFCHSSVFHHRELQRFIFFGGKIRSYKHMILYDYHNERMQFYAVEGDPIGTHNYNETFLMDNTNYDLQNGGLNYQFYVLQYRYLNSKFVLFKMQIETKFTRSAQGMLKLAKQKALTDTIVQFKNQELGL